MKGQIIGGMHLETKGNGGEFSEDELELLITLANQAMVAIENAWLYETVKNNYFGTIQALVNALEASDQYTKGHSERVRHLSLELARYVGLDYKELEVLEHAAILHDIGKIGIDSMVPEQAGPALVERVQPGQGPPDNRRRDTGPYRHARGSKNHNTSAPRALRRRWISLRDCRRRDIAEGQDTGCRGHFRRNAHGQALQKGIPS